MSKVIVLHDRYSNQPVVIRISAINGVRKVCDRIGDTVEECSEILIGTSFFLGVKETIGTVMTKIRNVESEELK